MTQIIHWGPASDVENYIQECGRAGRNGQQSSAVLYMKRSDLEKKHLKGHGGILHSGKSCRRALLCSYLSLMSRVVHAC